VNRLQNRDTSRLKLAQTHSSDPSNMFGVAYLPTKKSGMITLKP
jgi:hypothetical protein